MGRSRTLVGAAAVLMCAAAAFAQAGPLREAEESGGASRVSWSDGALHFRDPRFSLDLSNRFQLRWTRTGFDEPSKDSAAALKFRRFKTRFTGWAWSRDLAFRVQLDWASAGTRGGPLDDAYIQYDATHGKKRFMVRAGQGKTPFGRQSMASTATDMFADRSFVTIHFCGIRDAGLMVAGQLGPPSRPDLVEYSAGVFNGAGRGIYSNPDGRVQTDYRLVVSPWGSAGYDEASVHSAARPRLSLGLGWEHNGRRSDTPGTPGLQSGSYSTGACDVLFKYRRVSFYGEYFGRTSRPAAGAALDSRGVNLQVGLLAVPERAEVVVGYWTLDPEGGTAGDRKTEAGIGINLYLSGFNNKFQADFRRIRDERVPYDSHELRLQYQLVF